MKKLLIGISILFVGGISWALGPGVWKSSNTATADTAQKLCNQTASARRGVFHGACVNTGAAGTLTIYNSSSTAVSPIAAINTANLACLYYDVFMSSGIVYTNSATGNVTMMFDCY